MKTELSLPPDGQSFALSPDGRSIAYAARGHVWVRDLSALEPRDVATASLSQRGGILWSPDSASIGYNTADGKFWVVAARGGTPLQVCTIPETRQLMGATWRRDGTIVLAVWRGNLYQVPASGGEPRTMLTIDPGKEVDFHMPVALPNGGVVVATHVEPSEGGGAPAYRLEIIDGSQREVILAQSQFQPFAYIKGGYLLTIRVDANQGIWAFPYQGRGALRIEDAFLVAPGAGLPSADDRDTLLYSLAPAGPQVRELAWVDRGGHVTGQIGAASDLSAPALSPDGTRVAFSARVDQTLDIWVRDVASGADSRVSFEADGAGRPIWYPAGRRVAYRILGGGVFGTQLVARDVGGASERKDLVAAVGGQFSRDGRYLAFWVDDRGRNRLRYATVSAGGELSPGVPLFKSSPEPDASGAVVRARRPSHRLRRAPAVRKHGSVRHALPQRRGAPASLGGWRTRGRVGGKRRAVFPGRLDRWAETDDGCAHRRKRHAPCKRPAEAVRYRRRARCELHAAQLRRDAGWEAVPDAAPHGTRGSGRAHWVLVQNWPAEFARAR